MNLSFIVVLTTDNCQLLVQAQVTQASCEAEYVAKLAAITSATEHQQAAMLQKQVQTRISYSRPVSWFAKEPLSYLNVILV